MRSFFGGQIQTEYRGDLAAVVTTGHDDDRYSVFLYEVLSDEFIYLTGAGTIRNPVERVYMGISHDAGGKITERVSFTNKKDLDLTSLDQLVVGSHFLDQNLEKPKRIVLESTNDGYQIVSE